MSEGRRKVLFTRVLDKDCPERHAVQSAGCAQIELEVLRFEPGREISKLSERLRSDTPPDLIALTSARASEALAAALGPDLEVLPVCVAVGKATAEPLARLGVEVEISPGTGALEMAEWLLARHPEPRRALFLRGNLSLDTLPDALEDAGWEVEELEVYRTIGVHVNVAQLLSAMDKHLLAAAVFASPSAVDSLRQNMDSAAWRTLMGIPCIAQGTTTEIRLTRAGATRVMRAPAADGEGVAEALTSILKG